MDAAIVAAMRSADRMTIRATDRRGRRFANSYSLAGGRDRDGCRHARLRAALKRDGPESALALPGPHLCVRLDA